MILASDGVNNNSWYQILPTNGVYMVVEEKLWKSHKTALIINLPFFLKSFKIMSLPFPNVDIASNKKDNMSNTSSVIFFFVWCE